MVPDRRPGRIARPRFALAVRPFLQPDGPSGPTGAGMLVLADRAGATDATDSLRPAGQPDDVSPRRRAGADGGRWRWALQRPAFPRRGRGVGRSRGRGRSAPGAAALRTMRPSGGRLR